MPFRPFGDPFRIDAIGSPDTVKARIRAQKKGWFDAKYGPRGWIVGPVFCLWHSAFDSYGPMAVGVIRRDGFGTRLSGRAGSDLNGLAMMALLGPPLLWLFADIFHAGQGTPGMVAVLLMLVVGVPATFWMAHTDRREAAPLVRFLERVVGKGQSSIDDARPLGEARSLTLTVNEDAVDGPVTKAALRDTLSTIGPDEFLILSVEPEVYIQTISVRGDFVIERRCGTADSHFRAKHRSAAKVTDRFSFQDTLRVLIAWASEGSDPVKIEWQRVDLR